MKTQHTPGVWFPKTSNPKDLRILQGEKGKVIAEVINHGLIQDEQEAKANIQLIAASPEMIEALLKFKQHGYKLLENGATRYMTTEEENTALKNYVGAVIETSQKIISQVI